MSRENSALIALEELKNLEARRVQQVEDDVRAKEQAEQRAREDAERKARETAERERAEAEEKARQEQEAREQREREERIRVAEAEARSRAEQEARLREEQMRLDAQVKMAERKKTPYWLYATAGLLTIGLGVGGYMLYKNNQEKQQIAAQKEADDLKHQQELDAERKAREAAEAEATALKEEAAELAEKQKELTEKLATVTDESEKAKLLAEQAELDKQKAAVDSKIKKGGGGGGSKTPTSKPITKERDEGSKIKLGGDGSALGGL